MTIKLWKIHPITKALHIEDNKTSDFGLLPNNAPFETKEDSRLNRG